MGRQQLEKNRTILEDIKKRATEVNKPTWKVAGINLNDITDETLQALSPEQIVQAREDQLKRERQEKIRQRKLESKRVDHLARAMREEGKSSLKDWIRNLEVQDKEFLEKAEGEKQVEQRKAHEANLKERDQLLQFKDAKDDWYNTRME